MLVTVTPGFATPAVFEARAFSPARWPSCLISHHLRFHQRQPRKGAPPGGAQPSLPEKASNSGDEWSSTALAWTEVPLDGWKVHSGRLASSQWSSNNRGLCVYVLRSALLWRRVWRHAVRAPKTRELPFAAAHMLNGSVKKLTRLNSRPLVIRGPHGQTTRMLGRHHISQQAALPFRVGLSCFLSVFISRRKVIKGNLI